MRDAKSERVRALFLAALRRSADARAAFLDDHAADCREEVEALLACHEASDGFLESPPLDAMLDALDSLDDGARRAPVALPGPGDRLGDFRIVGPLQRGGSSFVFRAVQLSLGRVVALKVIPNRDIDRTARAKARRELEIAARIQAPHLVTVFAAGEERELLYYAMQLVDGPDMAEVLAELTRAGPPSPEIRRRIVERVAEAAHGLAALHREGLVHRDVKPANIVLDRGSRHRPGEGEAVLVDLGLARASDASDRTRVAGTLLYMAPEALRGGAIGPPTDVFGLGLSLFDLLAAGDPLARVPGSSPALLRSVVPDVDRDLEAIVATATAPRPARRYRDGAEFAHDLDAWLAGRGVSARRVGPVARAWRWVARRPARALRAAAIACACTVAATLVVVGGFRVLDLVASVRELRTAWQLGDLATVSHGRERVPAPVAAWLMRDECRTAVATHAAADVLDAIAASGEVAGLDASARHVARDGLAAHPGLVAFLCHGLPLGGPTGRRARRLAGQLLFERPDRAAADTATSASLRRSLHAVLERVREPRSDGFVLTALAGCGNAETLDVLSRWLARREGPHAELVRLACMAMTAIVVRAPGCGFAPAILADDREAMLSRVVAALPGEERWAPSRHMHPSVALLQLAIAMSVLERRYESLSGAAGALRELGTTVELDAARGEPGLGEDLMRRAEADYGRGSSVIALVGRACGLLADDALRVTIESSLPAMAARHGVALAESRLVFEDGVRTGRAWWTGTIELFNADPITHLGGDAARTDRRATPIAVLDAGAETAGEVAWDFTVEPVATRGRVTATLPRLAPHARDTLDRSRHVCLLPLEGSMLELGFAAPSGPDGGWCVTLDVQKGVRGLLPFGGDAPFEVALDGHPLGAVRLLTDAGCHVQAFPLPPLDAGAEHRLAIRLTDDASTTLRVHSVSIRRR